MNWFEQMATAIRDRDKALAARARWDEKVDEAEKRMEELAARQHALTKVVSDSVQKTEEEIEAGFTANDPSNDAPLSN